MRVLVTGASGFLGRVVCERLGREHEVVPVAHRHGPATMRRLDLRDAGALAGLVREVRPDAVFHGAAYRDPDFCEANPDETRRLNVAPLQTFCEALPAACRLLFVSTDYVFDGTRPAYREESERNPICVYGVSKREAEDLVLARGGHSLVLRIPLLVGDGPTLDASGFVSQLVHGLQDPTPQVADNVIIRYPTFIRDVAEAAAFLFGQGVTGVCHFSGDICYTRYSAFVEAASLLGLSAAHIQPVGKVVTRAAARPVNSQLCTDKIRALGFRQFTHFRDVIRETVARFGIRPA